MIKQLIRKLLGDKEALEKKKEEVLAAIRNLELEAIMLRRENKAYRSGLEQAEKLTRSWYGLLGDVNIVVVKALDEDITDMSQLDAADFKDKAGETWSLVEDARELLKNG